MGFPSSVHRSTRKPSVMTQAQRRPVEIVTISERLGHSKPDITLRIYAHLFRKDDGKAAAAINAALAGPHKA
jgi:integrase